MRITDKKVEIKGLTIEFTYNEIKLLMRLLGNLTRPLLEEMDMKEDGLMDEFYYMYSEISDQLEGRR